MSKKRIAMIGASGHSFACIPDAKSEELEYIAVTPGSSGENVDPMANVLCRLGYSPERYSDYREMLKREKPDVVVVDNYYAEHFSVIMDAFDAGCHVISEKPAAINLEQIEQLKNAWNRAGTAFSAMFTYRYLGSFYRAWCLVQEGAVGKVRLLNTQKSYKLGVRPDFMSRHETYGGTIPWVGIHAIDWIYWMSGGTFEAVSAMQCASEAPNGICPETTAMAQFRMNDGMMASVTMDYLNPPSAPIHGDDRIRIVGSEGVLEVRERKVTLINADGVQYPENLPNEDMFADFLRQVDGKTDCRIMPKDVFAVTEAAAYAQLAANKGEIVFIQ